jgi:HAD superfamily hydrolase (TIGR01509 family)
MIKAVIFDMDGVIVDSEPLHYKVFMDYTQSKFGFTISDEEYNTFIGTTNKSIFSKLQKKYNIEGDIDAVIEEYEGKCIEFLLTSDERPIYGVDTLIKSLYQNKMKLALASSSPKNHINIVLELFAISQFFDAKVSGQEVKSGKPAPDIFLRAAEMMDVLPAECLVFEDSKNGVAAAKEAGMKCFALNNLNSGNQDLSRADKIISDFHEIDIEFIKSFCI